MFRIIFTLLTVVLITTNASGSIPAATDCDTLILSNGATYVVKNVVATKNNVSFSYCDDVAGTVQTVPWMQVQRIKKADGSELVSPAFEPEKPAIPEPVLTAAEQQVEDQVKAILKMSRIAIPLTVVFGAGIVMAIIVLDRSRSLFQAIAGHPNEARLKKMLKRARRNSILHLAVFAVAAIVLISFVAYLNYLANHL